MQVLGKDLLDSDSERANGSEEFIILAFRTSLSMDGAAEPEKREVSWSEKIKEKKRAWTMYKSKA